MLDLKSLVPWGQKSENAPVSHESRQDLFTSFRQEMDRVFDDFFRTGFGLTRRSDGDGWTNLTPRLDVSESENEIVVTAELPGVDEKDLDVSLSGDVLTIKGEKKYEHESKDDDRHYVERHFGTFSRSVRLPFDAGDQNVDASMKNGVLTVTVPKPADLQTKAKRIEVHSS